MPTLLVRNAAVLVTMDAQRREIAGGGLFARDGRVEQVGPTADLPATADEVLDLAGHVVLPGLVNTHHHLYQTLTRAVPAAQNVVLFDWLKTLYPIWANLTPEAVYISTLTGLAELSRSPAAPPPPTICISTPTAAAWMTKSRRPPRSACAFTLRAAR